MTTQKKELIKKIIDNISENYKTDLEDFAWYVMDRATWVETDTIDDAKEYLLELDPCGEQEDTARESGFLAWVRQAIWIIRSHEHK